MKRILGGLLGVFLVLALVGCGGGGSSAPVEVTTHILSDAAFDGDIARDLFSPSVVITQGNTQSVFAGVNPVTNFEYRAFLDFPLTGSGGVPGNAVIVSALLDIFLNSIVTQTPSSTIPIRIDLVSFQPPTLIASDYDRTLQPALATMTFSPPISQSDFGRHIFIDVTPLMVEAQRLGLLNFQLRILEDLSAAAYGRIEINDTTGVDRATLAPLLSVTYF